MKAHSSISIICPILNEEKNITLILAMHDLNMASRYCRRIILLNDGVIASDGLPEEVLRKEIIERVYGVNINLHNLDGEILVHPAASFSQIC